MVILIILIMLIVIAAMVSAIAACVSARRVEKLLHECEEHRQTGTPTAGVSISAEVNNEWLFGRNE